MTEKFTSSEELREGVFALCVIVMSAPIAVYGQGVWIKSVVVYSGSKDMSKGCAVMSLVFMCLRLMSNFVLFLIYPDVDRAG